MLNHTVTPTLPTHKPNYKTHLYASACDGAQKSFWLAQVARHDESLYVVVCANQHAVNQLETELAFFGIDAHVFADWETLVYDKLSPHQDIVSERINLLSHMPTTGILLVSIQTLMQRIVPPSWLLGRYFDVSVGARFDIEAQRQRLLRAGYRAVDTVYSSGEFAIRGGIVDVFVMGQALPFRLELFDDEIDSIRFFDPETQRTLTDEALAALKKSSEHTHYQVPSSAKVEAFRVLPAREFPFDEGKEQFRHNVASLFPNTSHRKFNVYQEVMSNIASAGIEYYQPLFFDLEEWHTGSLFAYLPKTAVIVAETQMVAAHQEYWAQLSARYESLRHNQDEPIVPLELLYLSEPVFFEQIKAFAQVVLTDDNTHPAIFRSLTCLAPTTLTIDHHLPEPLQALLTFVHESTVPVLLVAETAGRRESLLELLKGKLKVTVVDNFLHFLQTAHLQSDGLALTIAPIERGVHLVGEQGFCILSETQIFGRQVLQTRRRKTSTTPHSVLVKSITELNEGALVVHIEHGIGRYEGLVKLDAGDGEQEFIALSFADDAKIYVPITHLALIGKYSGLEGQAVSLSKIGSGRWDKARQKALEQIYDTAAELLNIQARRQAKQGVSFEIDMAQYELFASEFAFEETLDQRLAIEAVMADMRQSKPMDRLICGDVGFGKTEVAMRAAFIAVQAGFQVAVLVPTTLLAGQHEDNFINRFADWAIKVESLSRFGTKKHHDKVLKELSEGKVDIIIGTHRLLQDDVRFKKLGLMIIDEEHRFGVRHKARIKSLQADIDSLSMTATPIPRTLNMALSGMQDISIIATPPARRLAIKTFVLEKTQQTIKEAVLREILRGGQVYYLHNDVATIEAAADSLSELIPEAMIGVAHGQLHERALSAVMSDFYHKKFNILVASTIIETGIDVPNANTIIINRADKFGLAQLHQLRGRVGRSHHQAYCYLLVPSIKGLTSDAKRRLDAISRANELGAGFVLASEDLEIRGAGELLGKEQSGHMQTMGFGLYMDMLNRATKAIKAGKAPKLDTPLDLVSDINMHTSALIDDEYLGDVHERLLFYKRIASTETTEELSDIRTEMIDRFGAMPIALVNLFLVHKVRILAHPLGIVRIDANERMLTFEFSPETPVDAGVIIRLIQSNSAYRMLGATGIRYTFKQPKEVNERFEAVFELLKFFGQGVQT